jgi:hypothetical protein
MLSNVRRRPTTAIDFESLESRQLLAAFGTPWPEPRDLTISFPADGVEAGKFSNDIRQTLDQVAARQQWEELALRAFQTWAIHADINVGLRNDYDLDFGTPGLAVGDPRFGDFRIGSFPQIGLVASSVPFQSVAGTYSGDLLLNSNEQFKYHNWQGGVAPEPSTLGPDDRDLFSVLLHETGNTLGLDDNLTDWSVMFRQYTVPKGVLTAPDIADIQALYGARTDPYELIDNGQLQAATLIPTPVGFDTASNVIRIRGSLVSAGDVDHYEIIPATGQETATIGLKSAGISLLNARIEILDGSGQVLHQAQPASVFDNDATVQVTGLQNHSALYVRVTAADPSDVYSVGDYELEVDYRAAVTRAADPVAGDYDSGADFLFTNFALVDPEQGANDTQSDAETVSQSPLHSNTRYEFESSVSAAIDVDFLKVTAPAEINGRLLIDVAAVGNGQPGLLVEVVDFSGQSVGAAGRLRPDGSWTVEVAQPQAGKDYYLRISVDPSSTVSVGNYIATAEFIKPASQMNELAFGEVSSTVDEFVRWTAAKTKLYRFDLTASGGGLGEGVKLTIYDAHTQKMQLVVAASSDLTRSALAWLQQGDYILHFTATSTSGNAVANISYSVTTDGISDDQDEDPEDYEDDPNYDPYGSYETDPAYDYEYYYYYYYP